MVRQFGLFILLLISFCLNAQDSTNKYIYKNTLKASATLAPGFMLSETQTNIYVHGHLEYFPEDKVSLRGELFWFTGAQQKPSLFKQNSTLLFGALYHFHKNRFDCFIGLQPGVSITQPSDVYYAHLILNPAGTVTDTLTYKMKVVPVFSPVVGITFYPGKYINFFLEARYVSGKYYGYLNGKTISMDDIRISAGLGFQIPFKKK